MDILQIAERLRYLASSVDPRELDQELHALARECESHALMAPPDAAIAVNGWRQAVGIIDAQRQALDWCVLRFETLKKLGRLPQSETDAREFSEKVLGARKLAGDYLAAMRLRAPGAV